eukprot:1164295-Alexandrium_andersonii.AAC.1
MRSSALAMLASPAALRIASNRARRASECLVPAAGLWVRTLVHFKHPAAHPCSSKRSFVRLTLRGAAGARAGG